MTKLRRLECKTNKIQKLDVSNDMMDVFNYQLMSACYGRDMLKFNIDWYEKMLSQIEGAQL